MSVQKDKANDSFLEKWTQVTILTNLHRKPKKYAVSSIDNIVNFDLYRMHLVEKLEKVKFNIHKYLSYMSLITLILAGYGVTG